MTIHYQNKIYQLKNNRILQRDIELIKLIKKNFSNSNKLEVLDVGCGNGDLIEKLNKIFPNINFLGIDIDKNLIKKANKRKLNNCTFMTCNFINLVKKKKFDIVIASGLISFFSDYKKPLKRLIYFLKNSKSRIFIFGRFNSSNIDVKIKIRDNTESKSWKEGFNSYSIKTISNFLKKSRKKFHFAKFNLKSKLKESKSLTRTFTIITNKNKKIILNKANIIAEFFFLVIKN